MIDPKEFAALQSSIKNLGERLDALEGRAEVRAGLPVHPSMERYTIAEAIVDGLFDAEAKEKACTYEPGKPCDHCSMCSCHGF